MGRGSVVISWIGILEAESRSDCSESRDGNGWGERLENIFDWKTTQSAEEIEAQRMTGLQRMVHEDSAI